MRAYLRLFISLLIPLGSLFMVISIAYFKLSYDFTKAMKLGVLSGVFIGIFVSLITALVLLVLRRTQKRIETKIQKPEKIKESNTANKPENKKEIIHVPIQAVEKPLQKDIQKTSEINEQTLIVLMDKEVAYAVLRYALINQKINDITTKKTNKGTIVIHAKNEGMQITIDSLTRHTSQILLKSNYNTEETQKIIACIKEKEHSFLQY